MKDWKWMVLVLGVSMPAAAFAGGLNMQPGLWEMTVKVTMTGMPFAIPAQTKTLKECLEKGQIEHPWKSMQTQKDCKFTDVRITGHSASYKMKCGGEEATLLGKGIVIVDSPTRMHERTDMTMQTDGRTVTMHAEGSGRRLGSCSGGQ